MKYKCTFVISEANRILNPGFKTTRSDVRQSFPDRSVRFSSGRAGFIRHIHERDLA